MADLAAGVVAPTVMTPVGIFPEYQDSTSMAAVSHSRVRMIVFPVRRLVGLNAATALSKVEM